MEEMSNEERFELWKRTGEDRHLQPILAYLSRVLWSIIKARDYTGVKPEDGEDLVQETALRVCKDYDPKRGAFSTFAGKVAENLLRDYFGKKFGTTKNARGETPAPTFVSSWETYADGAGEGSDGGAAAYALDLKLETRAALNLVFDTIRALTPDDAKVVLILAIGSHLEEGEIAALLQMPRSTVSSHIRRGLREVAAALKLEFPLPQLRALLEAENDIVINAGDVAKLQDRVMKAVAGAWFRDRKTFDEVVQALKLPPAEVRKLTRQAVFELLKDLTRELPEPETVPDLPDDAIGEYLAAVLRLGCPAPARDPAAAHPLQTTIEILCLAFTRAGGLAPGPLTVGGYLESLRAARNLELAGLGRQLGLIPPELTALLGDRLLPDAALQAKLATVLGADPARLGELVALARQRAGGK